MIAENEECAGKGGSVVAGSSRLKLGRILRDKFGTFTA